MTGPISDLITTPTAAAQNLRLLDAPVLLYAHTHHAAHWHTPHGSDRPRPRHPRPGIQISLDPEDRALLNPGAVTGGAPLATSSRSPTTRPTIATWHQASATNAA